MEATELKYNYEGQLPSGVFQCSIINVNNEEIAVCWGKKRDEVETRAKRFCASDDMFEACERALNYFECEGIYGQARLLLAVAIHKAIK